MIFCTRTLLALTALTTPALAQPQPEPATLAIGGHIAHPRTYAAAELAALPHATADLPAHPGEAAHHLSGVLLWPLLDQAAFIDQPGRKTHLQHVILPRGRDGYTVALSIAELDPALEGKPVLIVTERDGKSAPHLDLYVPGDHRPARRVHDLVAIDVQ